METEKIVCLSQDVERTILSPISPLYPLVPIQRHADSKEDTRYSTYSVDSSSTVPTILHSASQNETGIEYPIQIKTTSRKLSSGFPYHPLLFDLHISPRDWTTFSSSIVRATKLTVSDRVTIAAAVAGIACTTLVGTSIYAGRKVYDRRQTKQVRSRRAEEAALGQVLKTWNENFFVRYGIEAQLEVSEAVLRTESGKKGEKRRSLFERIPFVLIKREMRERRNEERKFMMLLNPVGTASRMVAVEKDGDEVIAELPGEGLKELPVSDASDDEARASSSSNAAGFTLDVKNEVT